WAALDCQWIDVTNVPAGSYILQITVNPDRILAESNYSNNVSFVPVTLPPTAGIPPRPDGRRIPGSPLLASPAGEGSRVRFEPRRAAPERHRALFPWTDAVRPDLRLRVRSRTN